MLKTLRKSYIHQSVKEEIFNSISHAAGILLAITGLVLLIIFSVIAGNATKIISTSIYGISLVLMYSASTIYHATQDPRLKHLFKVFDHTSIYILIAGTYTPFTLNSLPAVWGWSIFGVIWGLAVFGILFKIFFIGRYEFMSLALYLLMGWLIVVAFKPIIENIALTGLILLLAGGLCYTFGIIFYVIDERYHYSHFLWHLFVLAGSIFQFFAVLFYVVRV